MIKELKRRFIWSAMLAVTVLLVLLLGVINVVNAYSIERQSDALLVSLSSRELPGHGSGAGRFFAPGHSENLRLGAVHFTVVTDYEGRPVHADVSRIASVDRDKAMELARAVKLIPGESGELESFKYMVQAGPGSGYSIVFLDTSQQSGQILRLLLLSLGAGALCWLLMLLLLLLISGRAVRPIVENVEKQRRFITDAGHELKTPLAIILANTEAMELKFGESKYSRSIRHQSERLSALTQNMLSLARADEQMKPESMEWVDLSQLCRRSMEDFAEPARRKGISLESDIQENIFLSGSPAQLSQLLSILMDNAVKYSPEKGFISLSLSGGERPLILLRNSVTSTEVPAESMFDRFFRGDSSRSSEKSGFGIGLSAAKSIVKLHRGEISACYEGDNIICFTVKL